jgi:hypothetical protein
MEVMTNESPLKPSRYLSAGAPTHCFLPSCRQPFNSRCVHGQDGHYYCSEPCCDEARSLGLSQVKELTRRRA